MRRAVITLRFSIAIASDSPTPQPQQLQEVITRSSGQERQETLDSRSGAHANQVVMTADTPSIKGAAGVETGRPVLPATTNPITAPSLTAPALRDRAKRILRWLAGLGLLGLNETVKETGKSLGKFINSLF